MKFTDVTTAKTTSRLLIAGGLLSFLLLTVAACGQRGPLYLPDDSTRATSEPQADTEEEKAASNKRKDDKGTANEETP